MDAVAQSLNAERNAGAGSGEYDDPPGPLVESAGGLSCYVHGDQRRGAGAVV